MACYFCTECGDLKDDDFDIGHESKKELGLICTGCFNELELVPLASTMAYLKKHATMSFDEFLMGGLDEEQT